jgi:hypothetical protein
MINRQRVEQAGRVTMAKSGGGRSWTAVRSRAGWCSGAIGRGEHFCEAGASRSGDQPNRYRTLQFHLKPLIVAAGIPGGCLTKHSPARRRFPTFSHVAREATKSEQFDAPWKLAVERFLQPLLQLGFPAVHDSIDWRHAPEFLDTELQELGLDHAQGGRTVDKLVKVRRLDGQEQWLFIHLEIQAQPDPQFPHRMWVYYYRLCDKHGEGVVSLAILADAQPNWRPHFYETEIAGCRLRFEFPVFKVLDLRGAQEVFERTGNPFALVVAVQQVALATRHDPAARYEGRWGIVCRLRRGGLERRELQDLLRVIQVLTRMPRELELRFKSELATLPTSEGHMTTTELITPLEEIAMEEGFAKGRVEGRVEGLAEGLLNVLESRFGVLPEGVHDQLKQVSDESRLRQAMRLAVTEPTLERFLAKF